MKTVYGHICEGCESVRACSQMGCRPIEQDKPTEDNPRSMLANRWFWLFGALCVAIWSGLWFAIVG